MDTKIFNTKKTDTPKPKSSDIQSFLLESTSNKYINSALKNKDNKVATSPAKEVSTEQTTKITTALEAIQKTQDNSQKIKTSCFMIPVRNIMKCFGYKQLSDKKRCFGIAYMNMQAAIREDSDKFINRYEKLSLLSLQRYNKKLIYCSNDELNTLLNMLPREEKQTWHAFCEGIYIAQGNFDNGEKSETEKALKYPKYPYIEWVTNILGPDKKNSSIDTFVPHVKKIFLTKFTPSSIENFITKLQKNNPGKHFSLMIEYTGHAVSIATDGKQWVSINHNRCTKSASLKATLKPIVTDEIKRAGSDGFFFAQIVLTAQENTTLIIDQKDIDKINIPIAGITRANFRIY